MRKKYYYLEQKKELCSNSSVFADARSEKKFSSLQPYLVPSSFEYFYIFTDALYIL